MRSDAIVQHDDGTPTGSRSTSFFIHDSLYWVPLLAKATLGRREELCGLIKRIGTDDMSKVTEGHLLEWRDALMASKLSKVTVRDGYVAAMKAFFGWAKRMKKLSVDPSMNVHVEVSEKHGKKMRGFKDWEAKKSSLGWPPLDTGGRGTTARAHRIQGQGGFDG